MIHYSPLKQSINNLKDKLFFEPLEEEVTSIFQRLPKSVGVSWTKDGDYLVGEIKDGDQTYVIQARSADEFIEMINDTLFSVYRVKEPYVHKLFEENLPYTNKEAFRQLKKDLEDQSVTSSDFSFNKKPEFQIVK